MRSCKPLHNKVWLFINPFCSNGGFSLTDERVFLFQKIVYICLSEGNHYMKCLKISKCPAALILIGKGFFITNSVTIIDYIL